MFNSYDYSLRAAERILQTTTNDDVDALIKMFSACAKENSEDIRADCAAFFETVHGDVVSVECDTGPYVAKSSDGGRISYYYVQSVVVKTEEDTYLMAFKDCLVDDFCRDNEGLTFVWIIREEDRENDYTYWGDWESTGLYVDS